MKVVPHEQFFKEPTSVIHAYLAVSKLHVLELNKILGLDLRNIDAENLYQAAKRIEEVLAIPQHLLYPQTEERCRWRILLHEDGTAKIFDNNNGWEWSRYVVEHIGQMPGPFMSY